MIRRFFGISAVLACDPPDEAPRVTPRVNEDKSDAYLANRNR
jgi:hypothetical protein